MGKLPLGRDTGYPDKYAPEVLHAIPRAEGRAALGIEGALPFRGVSKPWAARAMRRASSFEK